MKLSIIFLFFYTILNVNVIAQNKNYNNNVFIYQSLNPIDSALDNNSMYCYIDKNNFINWALDAFRVHDMGMSSIVDTIRYQDTFMLQGNQAYMPHRITSSYKFTLRKKQIWVTEKLPNGKIQMAPYLDLNYKTLNPDFNFFEGFDKKIELFKHKSYFVKTKLLKSDTIFKFNDKIFHCWKFEAQLNAITMQYYSTFLIDKKTLLPISFEIYDSVNSNSLDKLKELKTTYSLLGILELNQKNLEGLHIWDENYK